MAYTDLAGADLTLSDLHGNKLQHANLQRATLVATDLSDTTLIEAIFWGADLNGTVLQEARLERADFRGARFWFADLSDTETWLGAVWNSRDSFWSRVRRLDITGRRRKPRERKTVFGATDIRNANWAGAAALRRYIEDENYLDEFVRGHKVVAWFWKRSCDYGRSFLRWAFVSFLLALLFGFWLWLIRDQLHIACHNTAPEWATMLYFSVVTFTTLGFGDVTPKTGWAELVVGLEVIAGYVMLGGLISIFANKLARRA